MHYTINFPTAEELSDLNRYEMWKQSIEDATEETPFVEAPVSHPVDPHQSVEVYNTATGQTFEVTESRMLIGWANLWVVYYMVGGIEHATRFDYSTGRAFKDKDSPYVCRNVDVQKKGTLVTVRIPLDVLDAYYEIPPETYEEPSQTVRYTRYA